MSNKPYIYNYIFVVTGYNCGLWIEQCIKSIIKQNLKNWHCLLCDDASSDESWNIMSTYGTDKRFTLLHNRRNQGACYTRWAAINLLAEKNMIEDEDVLLLIGGDDKLSDNNVLKIVDSKYKLYQAEVTYGNWKDSQTNRTNPLRYFPTEVLKNRTYRKYPPWVATAINTFKYKLFKQIDPNIYFKDKDGTWIKNCTDLAVMFPVLEMAHPHRIIPIKQVLYIYNSKYTHNTKSRFGTKHKKKYNAYIRKMPPFHIRYPSLINLTSSPSPPIVSPKLSTSKLIVPTSIPLSPPVAQMPVAPLPKKVINKEWSIIKPPKSIIKVKYKINDKVKDKINDKVKVIPSPEYSHPILRKKRRIIPMGKRTTATKPVVVKSVDGKYIVFRTRGGSTIKIKEE